jgi:hypothetical protein
MLHVSVRSIITGHLKYNKLDKTQVHMQVSIYTFLKSHKLQS